MRLPAESRVVLADADRQLQFARHGLRVGFHECNEVRKAPGADEVEVLVGSLLENRLRLWQFVGCEERRRKIRIRGDELGVEPDRFAKGLNRLFELTQPQQGDSQTVESESLSRVGRSPGSGELEGLVPSLSGVAIVPP